MQAKLRIRLARAASTTPLHRDLARAVGDVIRSEGLAPGVALNQQHLARRLGVSRTPLRAALDLLAEVGLVEIKPGSVAVANPTADIPAAGGADDPVPGLVVAIARARIRGEVPEEVMEADLQRRTRASRAELRRALDHLADMGAIRRRKGFGWRFEPGFASVEDRKAAYRFRLAVEPAALVEPGYALSAGWIDAMRARHEAVLRRDWRTGDAVAFFEMNADFHTGIVAGGGNRFFVQATDQQNRLRRLLNYNWNLGPDRMRISCTEHIGILDALAVGDQALAAARLTEHLSGTAAIDRRDVLGVEGTA